MCFPSLNVSYRSYTSTQRELKKQRKCNVHTCVIHKLSAAESKLMLLLKKFTLFLKWQIYEWMSTWRQKESELTTTLNRDNYSKMTVNKLTENTWYNMSVNMKSESLGCHDSNSRFSVWLTINVITLSTHQSVCLFQTFRYSHSGLC